ncbi:MAG: amidase [Deltaproteobacteria bacterium]|jgi:amidase|nr:amidase [Deltaproteobacteria bacterium]MBW2533594.1 amidase [Deltaproteobacteria bacterium]
MSPLSDYDDFDALGLGELVRRGEVHPSELAATAIERIERIDPQLGAVVYPLFDRGRAAAAQPVRSGPFAGVPYLLKDMVSHAGTPLSLGSRLLRAARFTPESTHEVVRRSEAAGLIVLGKTNACEFGLMPVTEPEAWGPTRNPWSRDHTPGGSSGGSAAAVAARMVPMAHGNDGGGSIRIPASCCGVFGLKPSRGRNPADVYDSPYGTTVEHCLSRSVRDSAALLDVTRGPRPGDRFWAMPPARPYLAEVTTEPGALRIAFTTADFCGREAHADAVAAVRDAAALCEELGHHVEPARPAVDGTRFNEAFAALWATLADAMYPLLLDQAKHNRWVRRAAQVLGDRALVEIAGRALTRSLRSPIEPFTRVLADIGAGITAAAFQAAAIDFQRATYAMAELFERYDCLLTPVLGAPPVRLGAFRSTDRDRMRAELLRYVAYTPIANVSGQPAMSVPLHWNGEGLPIGVQFIGGFAAETTLFRLAGQLERARPWHDRRPPLCA